MPATTLCEKEFSQELDQSTAMPWWGNLLLATSTIVSPLVLLLNWVGLVVGMIWLLVLGEWKVAGLGLIAMLSGGWLTGLLMWLVSLPALPFAHMAEKRKSLGLFLAVTVASSWLRYFFIALWMVASFQIFLHSTKSAALIPCAVMGFIVATGPWEANRHNEHELVALIPINTIALGLMVAFAGFNVPVSTALWYSIGVFNVFSLVHYRMVVDSVPGLPKSRELRWYESAWAYLANTMLILFGGYLIGSVGVVAGYINERIFNSNIPGYLKFLASGAVSTVSVVGCVMICVVFSLANRRH